VKGCIERGAKPLPEEEGVTVGKEEDLWSSLDLTGKAEITEAGLFGGVEETEETIGEILGEEIVKEQTEGAVHMEEIVTEEKAEEVMMAEAEEEISPLESEKISEEVSELIAATEKERGLSVEPLSTDILKEEISRTTERVLREAILSSIAPDTIKDELGRKAEGLFSNALPQIIQVASQEVGRIVKETLSPALDTTLRDTVEKAAWEVIPDIAERVTKEIIEASITTGLRETIEKVAWEVVPDMAEILIAKITDCP